VVGRGSDVNRVGQESCKSEVKAMSNLIGALLGLRTVQLTAIKRLDVIEWRQVGRTCCCCICYMSWWNRSAACSISCQSLGGKLVSQCLCCRRSVDLTPVLCARRADCCSFIVSKQDASISAEPLIGTSYSLPFPLSLPFSFSFSFPLFFSEDLPKSNCFQSFTDT